MLEDKVKFQPRNPNFEQIDDERLYCFQRWISHGFVGQYRTGLTIVGKKRNRSFGFRLIKKNSTCVVTMIIFRNWNHAFHGHWHFKCHFQHGDMKKNRNFARKWTSLSCGIFPFLIDDNEFVFILILWLSNDLLIKGSVSRLVSFATSLLNREK